MVFKPVVWCNNLLYRILQAIDHTWPPKRQKFSHQQPCGDFADLSPSPSARAGTDAASLPQERRLAARARALPPYLRPYAFEAPPRTRLHFHFTDGRTKARILCKGGYSSVATIG
ncbi:hypothetical protein TARUN_9791 [Trichoderma arundinaceum]|uniref:Uncharacterized protein n=1 Tax=Trichoderma arundinaceum TaxID=490622 RepID=A0A395N8N5_TRIAR|nr:hypothetical protein TARUN_9791 [Trichoderma arundinaceum]